MRISAALLCALMIAGGTIAISQPDPGVHRIPPQQRGRREFMDKLNLTDKQRADMAAIRTETAKTLVGIQAKIKLARIDMKALATAETPDKSAIEGKLKEINDLQYQEKKEGVDHLFAIYALLTPEQKKTFKNQMTARLSGGGMRQMGRRWQGFHRDMSDNHAPD